MARKRMIDPKFWQDDKMMSLTPMHRLLFIGIWNFSDDAGIHKNSDSMLKAEVFPCDDITVEEVGELKDELIQQQLIVPFNSEGIELFNVKNWTIYQYIQKPVPSKYTLPEDYCSPTVALQPNRIERNKKEKNIIKKSVEYEKQFPDKNVNKSLGKYLDYTNNPSHKGAIKWLTNEKEKKKPQFRKTPTGLLIAYCSKCGNQEFPNDEWQLKRGSECHKVEYVLEKPGENVGVTNP